MRDKKDNFFKNDVVRTINLPYNMILQTDNETELITLGQYIMPYACSWIYNGLKEPFKSATFYHEFKSHPFLRGSCFMEYNKLQCFRSQSISEISEIENFFLKDIEGLTMIDSMLQSYNDRLNINIAKILIDFESPSVNAFLRIWHHLFEKTPKNELNEIMYRLYLETTSIISKKEGVIPPFLVLYQIFKKLEEKNLKQIDMETFRKIYKEVLLDQDWDNLSPAHVRTVFTIGWASIISNNKNIRKIAIRNFFETAFGIPINTCFLIDNKTFLSQKINTMNLFLETDFKGMYDTFLGNFIMNNTEKIKNILKNIKHDEFKEENFILKELPTIASTYLQELSSDFITSNFKIFSKKEWKTFINTNLPIGNEPIQDFVVNYDQRNFENILKNEIFDALYYPEDCIEMVEKNAENNYSNLGDFSSLLFENEYLDVEENKK